MALHAASYRDHRESVGILLEKGAEIDAQAADHGTALQVALKHGIENVARLLLGKGADVDRSRVGGTALQIAAEDGRDKMVELLLEKGANVNAKSEYYSSAL